jgi:hypothetical protein
VLANEFEISLIVLLQRSGMIDLWSLTRINNDFKKLTNSDCHNSRITGYQIIIDKKFFITYDVSGKICIHSNDVNFS